MLEPEGGRTINKPRIEPGSRVCSLCFDRTCQWVRLDKLITCTYV